MTLEFTCQHRFEGGFELDASFTAAQGITAICGPSGSGKTTSLMLVAGLLRPRVGRIVLDGRVLVDTTAGTWISPHRRAVGVVFQDALLFPHRTVRANLNFGRRRCPDRGVDWQHVIDVLELEELLDRYPATLSGGQVRRVAIGRALLRGPKLLMLDEPWAGLDEPLQQRVAQLVQRCVREWHIPTLLVSHDLAFVRGFADELVQVDSGKIIGAQTKRGRL